MSSFNGDDNATVGIVNSMTRREIFLYVADMKKVFDPSEKHPGRKTIDRPKVAQRRFRFHNNKREHMFINPECFSWTKSSTGKREGYPSMPLRSRKPEKKAKSENGSPNSKVKAPSCARVLVHCVMWRLWNGFKLIPQNTEVSHLTGNSAVGAKDLCAESGVRNKHRIGCHGKTIPGEECKCGLAKENIPFCNNIQEPDASQFDLTADEKAVRDEKAALKALPSSGEKICKVCFSVINNNIDLDELTADGAFDFCLCKATEDAAQMTLCDTPGCGNPASF